MCMPSPLSVLFYLTESDEVVPTTPLGRGKEGKLGTGELDLLKNIKLTGEREYGAGFEPRKLGSSAISMRLLARKYDGAL